MWNILCMVQIFKDLPLYIQISLWVLLILHTLYLITIFLKKNYLGIQYNSIIYYFKVRIHTVKKYKMSN